MMLAADELIRYCRKFRGMTQHDLAIRVGITQTEISQYECGRREPKYATVVWILNAMGFNLLLSKEEDKWAKG